MLRLALFQPDIPQNTGTILRLAACLGVGVDVVLPTGFDITDRALRRAGLDYLDHVDIARHADWDAFASVAASRSRRLVLLTTQGRQSHTHFRFSPADTLVLGRESAGVPARVHEAVAAGLRVPMVAGLRSLNVAVTAAIVLGEALRQIDGFPS